MVFVFEPRTRLFVGFVALWRFGSRSLPALLSLSFQVSAFPLFQIQKKKHHNATKRGFMRFAGLVFLWRCGIPTELTGRDSEELEAVLEAGSAVPSVTFGNGLSRKR